MTWSTKKLSDVCDLERGTEPGSAFYIEASDKSIPFLRVGDLTGKIDAPKFVKNDNANLQIVEENETLITFDGTPGIVMRGLNGAIASGIRVVRNLKPEIDNDFLFYYLQTPTVQKTIKAYSKGATIIHASSAIEHIKIPLPPLKIQKQIVERLDKIVEAQKLNDGLIQKADELYRSLLHDELNAKFKNQNAKSQFKIKKLGEIADFKRGPFGGSLKKEIFVSSGYKVYEQSNVIYDNFESGNYFITEQKYKEMIDFVIKPGDLLISCSGTIGKIAIVPPDAQDGIINQALLKISPLQKVVSTIFLKYLLETPYLQDKLTANTRGSAIKNVASVKEIKQIDIFIPPLKTQKQIVAKLSAAQEYRTQLLAQKMKLKELFDSVLHKSMQNDSVLSH